MTTMTADDLADSINRGKKWKVIGCIGHDCEECQTRIAKDASHRSTAQEVDMKMVIDRAVVEQALEAMEAADVDPHSSDAVYKAITALRAALAQQAEPVEPVAWYQKRGQEVLTSHPACWGREDKPWTPLYTAPPQRKPLTEEVAALTAQRDALLEALRALVRNEGLDPYSYLDKGIGTATAAGQRWLNARAAIKALEDARTFTGAWPTGSKAITNLRAALAQQDEPRNQCGETCERAKLCAACAQVLAQQAEPVEPVAKVELMMTGGNAGLATRIVEIENHLRDRLRPGQQLYIAPPPPQRKLLTEEEILKAIGWERAEMYMKLAPNFPVDEAKQETLKNARAVERAAWEKNNG